MHKNIFQQINRITLAGKNDSFRDFTRVSWIN